jgi:predicted aldo/keto reductase-like oxidoreductase
VSSSHRLNAILEVMDHPAMEVVQYPFNFIETDALEILKKSEEKNIGFIAMKPFGGGMLDDASACVRFLMQYEGAAVNPGFEEIAEIEEVVGLAKEAFPLSRWDIASIKRFKEQLGDYFCRRCGYCKPCAQGIDIVALMAIESSLLLNVFFWINF